MTLTLPETPFTPIPLQSSLGISQLPPPPALPKDLTQLYDVVQVWEPPRRRPEHRNYRYVLAIDPGDGIGQNRSVIDIVRVGTVLEPAEQVAQFVSVQIAPADLAFIADPLGWAYIDDDGFPAKIAVELNNHGRSTQDMLQLHLQYPHFYRWEYVDRIDPNRRFAKTAGWVTTPSTRPIILDRYLQAVTTRDPITGRPDLIVNAPLTLEEMRGFYSETGLLADAEASKHGFDDCIMAGAIGNYIAWRWLGGESVPAAEVRRVHSVMEQRRRDQRGDTEPRDYRNSDCTLAEMRAGMVTGGLDEDPEAGYDVAEIDPRYLF